MGEERNEHSFDEIRAIGMVSQDGVFLFNLAQNRFIYINPALIRILEINRELLMEEPEIALHGIPQTDQEYLKLRYAEFLQSGVSEEVRVRISKSKTEKLLSLNAYRLKGIVIGFVKNTTKEKEHEDYLINFGARKDAILDMVSQNLSTPLNLSSFTLSLIERAVQERKYYKLDAHIKLMREVTADCIRLIDDFLQEEHLMSASVHPKINRFDVMAKTMVVLEKLRVANPEKKFMVKTAIKHLFINGDEVKYFQIIHNLLSNAIKFTRPNGQIELSLRERQDEVEIKISDDGIGIPDHLKPFLFERKSRAARPGLKGEISNGIGLFVVSELTRLMDGRISVESRELKGSTFILELPKYPRSAEENKR